MKVPPKFADQIRAAASMAGVSPVDVARETLFMAPDAFLIRYREMAAEGVDGDDLIPPELEPVLDGMAADFGMSREGLLVEMAGWAFRAASTLVAENVDLARELRKAHKEAQKI